MARCYGTGFRGRAGAAGSCTGPGEARGELWRAGEVPGVSAREGGPPPAPLPFSLLSGHSPGLPSPGSAPSGRLEAPRAGRRQRCSHERGSLTSRVPSVLTRHRRRDPPAAHRHAAPGRMRSPKAEHSACREKGRALRMRDSRAAVPAFRHQVAAAPHRSAPGCSAGQATAGSS